MKKNIKALLFVVLALALVVSLVACGHQHTYSTEWTTNATHHWHEANCEHDDLKQFEGEHQFGAGTPNAAGTHLVYTCRVCQYEKTEEIPVHQHTYEGEWLTQTQATMLAEGTEYHVCTGQDCNERETRTVAKVEVASIAVTTQPTKLNYIPGEDFEPTGIVVTATGVDNSTANVTALVTFDKTTLAESDTAVTVSFGGKTATIAVTVKAPHVCVFDGPWTIDTPATIFAEGTKSRPCQGGGGCNEVETETIPQVQVTGITVKTQPNKTSYLAGQRFDATGIYVVANGADGNEYDVTALVSYDKATLTKADTHVIVSYLGNTASVEVTVTGDVDIISVKDARAAEAGQTLLVTGYYVGVAQNGPLSAGEILLKDIATDDLIAVTGLPDSYGTWPTVGYQYGDLVRLSGTVTMGDASAPNKKLLTFDEAGNPTTIDSTILSTNNKIEYAFDNVVTLDSWDDWQAFFKVDTAPTYTYVKLKGTIFANRYKSSGDNIMMSRVNMNGSATKVANIKPDDKRCVALRDNVLTANVGEDWTNFFDSPSSTGSYPGKAMLTTEVMCVFTGANTSYFQLNVLEFGWFTFGQEEVGDEWTNADALVEVANAYLRQGKQIKYDQYSQRRHINISPEEATAQNILYMDCSSFVNAVYYETFGVNILPYDIYDKGGDAKTGNFRDYARDFNGKAVDVVGYWVNADYPTEAEQDALLAQVKENLQVGDVLNYRHGDGVDSGGHVYIYIGNDQFIHCTGSSYKYLSDASKSYDNGEMSSGSVQLISASMLFDRANSGQKRYLFYKVSNDETVNFGVIRPFARTLTPTAETVARMANKSLDVEKTVTEGVNSAVYKDGTITYKLSIANKSTKSYKAVPVKEILDSDVTFVEASVAHRLVGNELSFAVDVAAGKTVTITWTVKVNANAAKSALVESNNTTVSGVSLATTVNTVSGYTKAQMESVAAKAKEYVTLGTTFESPIAMAKQLYKDVLGATLFDYTTATDLFADMFVAQDSNDNNTAVYTHPQLLDQSEIFKMVAYGMYGGYDVSWLQWRNNEQVRLIDKGNVSLGDVIVAQDGSVTRVFIYVGDGQLVVLDSKTNTCQLSTMGTSYSDPSHILVTLPAYDFYAVLRPSVVA